MTLTTQDALCMLKSGDAAVILFGEVSSAKETQAFLIGALEDYERLKKDAERYAYIRRLDCDAIVIIADTDDSYCPSEEALDVAIDAQIAKEKS